jgi:hypothetical protein
MSLPALEKPATGSTTPPPEQDSPLRDAVRAWERFWFSPADPTVLGLMRICFGLLLLYVHVSYSWGLFSFVGPEAWLDDQTITWLRHEQPIIVPEGWGEKLTLYEKGNYYWSIFFHVKGRTGILAVHTLGLAAMALFTLGLWTRFSGAISWVMAISYMHRAQTSVFGLDSMMAILMCYLLIGPSGAALSLDSWLEQRRQRRRGVVPSGPAPSVSANFATRLIQVHFCVIYLAAGTSKLLGSTWWNGNAPQMVILNYAFAPLDHRLYRDLMVALTRHRWLWETLMNLGALFTIAVEVGLPFLIWLPRLRWFMVCCSVMLHVTIGIGMGLVAFSLCMLIMVLAFVPPATVRQALQRLGTVLRRRRPAERSANARSELVLSRS